MKKKNMQALQIVADTELAPHAIICTTRLGITRPLPGPRGHGHMAQHTPLENADLHQLCWGLHTVVHCLIRLSTHCFS